MPPQKQRRQFHTNSKKHKKLPETAEDFINAAIEYEESGDRWRPGDKPKAGRFYLRAIDAYTLAASKQHTPTHFYALYNRARLQYELSQAPELTPTATKPERRALLDTALQNNQECLALRPTDEDALFMTSQALTSCAEALTEESRRDEAAQMLQHAVRGFERCYELQKAQFELFSNAPDPAAHPEAPSPTEEPPTTTTETAAEFAEATPVPTEETLADTLLALLGTYTVLIPLLAAPSDITALTTRAREVAGWLPAPQDPAAVLILAKLHCALAEAHYLYMSFPLEEWAATISASFPPLDPPAAPYLCEKADSHITLALAIAGTQPLVAWKHLAFASAALAEASKLAPSEARIYLDRGDVEVLRSRVGCEEAVTAGEVLRRNAGVFYRGAQKMGGEEERREGRVKEVVVGAGAVEGVGAEEELRGCGVDEGAVRRVIAEAVAVGVLGEGWRGRLEM